MADTHIILHQHGGSNVLQYEAFELPPPAPNEVRIRQQAIGLNFIDIYHRTGLYPIPLPGSLGTEAAGIVEDVGNEVQDFKIGDKVAYATAPVGAYTSVRNVSEKLLVAVPTDISVDVAAASLLKGMTAEFLIERCARITAGQTALVHAAAGGVGSILVQWLKALGIKVLAHSGSLEKASQIHDLGADLVNTDSFDTLAAWVKDQTNGRGVDVVFDGVGQASWQASLASIASRGLIVSFGNASGPVPDFSMLDLLKAGSVFVTRPTLFDYCAQPSELRASSSRLFDMLQKGKVKINIGQSFSLKDAKLAHDMLASRQTSGATILIP